MENNGKKLYWDWKHEMRMNCKARRPDLTIAKRNMACPKESNKDEKKGEKIRKYQQLCFKIRERREDFTIKVVPSVVGCLGGGLKRLKEDIK